MTVAPFKGWVYVLTNPAFPGLVKIGCTSRTPEGRTRELSSGTGVPTRFVVAWACPVSDWRAVETRTHGRLHACRPNGHREFFACSVDQARREIEKAARVYLRPAWLRLAIRPSLRRSPPAWHASGRARPPTDLLGGRLVAGILVAGLLVGALQPAMPSWAPIRLARSVLWIELHAPYRF